MGTYLSFLILYCLQRINGERTTYSIYHLLKGKKSSQTIQDAHLYQISFLFQTFPFISRSYFDEILLNLIEKNYIKKIDGEKYKVTFVGQTHLDECTSQMPIPRYLNGWRYHSIQENFWKRLSLLIQVCSNLINFESSYIPIHNDSKTADWLKTTLRKLSKNREDLARKLYNEIFNCLSTSNEIRPEAIICRLSGYKKIGLTSIQAAEMFHMEKAYYQIQFLNSLHYMIMTIESNFLEYPILHNVINDFQKKPLVLTNSSLITYRYLQSDYNIEEIASIRNLKTSTIEDHIVEIAINDPNFLLEPFVPNVVEKKITEAFLKLQSKQLKMIRQELNGDVSYFQIRLVLAKFGEQL